MRDVRRGLIWGCQEYERTVYDGNVPLKVVAFAGAMWLTPTVMVSASGRLLALCCLLSGCALIAAALLPVALARSFGIRSPLRALLVPSTPRPNRARAAWLLLPFPFALLLNSTSLDLATSASTWLGYMALFLLAGTAALAGAAAVTYALLRRRVLDIDFIISRTLAVAILSALVVGSFALLEWLLGTVLAGVSHATGWIANAALALTFSRRYCAGMRRAGFW